MFPLNFRKLKKLRKAIFRRENGVAGMVAYVGFDLSPIPVWNKVYVNFPIAYLGATAASFISPGYFDVALIFFFWFSNFAGLILLELGIETVMHKKRHLTAGMWVADILASVFVTGIFIYFMHTGVLGAPTKFTHLVTKYTG